jgi:hypothetical protein
MEQGSYSEKDTERVIYSLVIPTNLRELHICHKNMPLETSAVATFRAAVEGKGAYGIQIID